MGLFSKREPCPICGGKVKGLLPWTIDGQKICNDCYGVVDVPGDIVNHMSMDDFRKYLAFRTENQQLKENFQITQQVDFGVFDTKFMFDMTNRMVCMDKNLNTTIFHGSQIRSFVIREDSIPLLEGSAAGLQYYASAVPDRVLAMAPQIDHFRMKVQMHRNARNDDPQPHFDVPEPFRNFNVEIYFDHPYWDVFKADMSGPTFSNTNPDINHYMDSYHEKVMILEQLAQALMEVAFPNAGENAAAPAPAAAAPAATDTVTEIKRFKELLDLGVITEEEFTAKKRQLMGI